MSREGRVAAGQERVEVRPGVFLWQDKAKASTADKVTDLSGVETASIAPTENAAMPPAKARKP